MIDLEAVPAHVRAWVEAHLVPEMDAVVDRVKGFEAFAASKAEEADATIAALEALAAAVDPAATPAVLAAVATAKSAVAETKRILDDILAKVPRKA